MKDDDKRLLRLRYIYLYVAAGKVTEGKMEFEDFAKSAKEFVGKDVVLPYRPITHAAIPMRKNSTRPRSPGIGTSRMGSVETVSNCIPPYRPAKIELEARGPPKPDDSAKSVGSGAIVRYRWPNE